MKTDQLYIEDRSDYFSGNLTDIIKFKVSNLKLDKKTWKDLDFISLVMLTMMIKKVQTLWVNYICQLIKCLGIYLKDMV